MEESIFNIYKRLCHSTETTDTLILSTDNSPNSGHKVMTVYNKYFCLYVYRRVNGHQINYKRKIKHS